MSVILKSTEEIIQSYRCEIPLAHFLKNFYKAHPKLGSRDRKAISEAVYIYYRVALFFQNETSIFGTIAKGIILCGTQNIFLNQILTEYLPETIEIPTWETGKKNTALSAGITEQEWVAGHWQQPALFLRIQKNKEKNLALLTARGIPFELLKLPGINENYCISLANGTKVDQILPATDYIIQDFSSQSAITIAADFRKENLTNCSVWDVCAGAGGKSIFWKYLFPKDKIFATDIRKSILHNLRERFRLLNLPVPKTEVMDLSQENGQDTISQDFEIIICDVPCSGSGTWSRTPEQYYFFREEKLKTFQSVQYPIAIHASQKLKPGGIFVYITCSVFEAENENVVQKLLDSTKLRLLHQGIINGMPHKADSMFMAILENGATTNNP